MKKLNVFKWTGYGLLVVMLAGISVFVFRSNTSSSRIVLRDGLQEQRKILHNAVGEHACNCFSPLISYFNITNVTADGATFTWDCSEASSYQITYGTSSNKGTLFPSATPTVSYKVHSITLTGLKPKTLYHVGPSSICFSGCTRNESTGKLRKQWLTDNTSKNDWTFTTLAQTAVLSDNSISATTVLSEVKVAKITAQDVTITWKTNNPTTSLVEYGLTKAYGMKSGLNTDLVRDHDIQLFDLQFGTTYHFRTVSYAGNAKATAYHSEDQTFTTPSSEERIVNKEHLLIEPNPCSDFAMISYYCYQPVKTATMDILTLSGKLVATLESPASSRGDGWNKVRWDVTDNNGRHLKNGLYVYKIKFQTANNETEVRGSNLMVRR